MLNLDLVKKCSLIITFRLLSKRVVQGVRQRGRHVPVYTTFTIGECSPATDSTMESPRIYRTLHTCDRGPEAHVALLLARIFRDLRVMYEPPDLSMPEAAAHTVVMIDRLLATIDSHHRAIMTLSKSHAEHTAMTSHHGLQGFDSSRT